VRANLDRMPDPSRRLLVAALESELVAFPAELPGFDRLVTGPGKLQAAVALAEALSARPYAEIVVVGTGGSIDPTVGPGVHEIAAALQLDGIVGQHVSLPARVSHDRDGIVIATGDRFVDDAGEVAAIRMLGPGMVDMETYAYMWVAQRSGIPIRVFKAVTDNAQDGALTDWRAAVAHCSAQLRAHVAELYEV
jgi:adenosylhomocysteine nucleosidase